MRYAIVSKGLTVSQLQDETQRCGGRNLKVASASKQIFCDLDDVGLAKLKVIPGLAIKEIGKVSPHIILPPQAGVIGPSIYAASQNAIASLLFQYREILSPPLTGHVWTVAVLDSGIRKTHIGLEDKVIYEENFTTSPDCDDHYDHGTSVAFLIAGGKHAPGEEAGIAPGAPLMSLKVLNDDGMGLEEDVVLAIERVIALRKEAVAKGLSEDDPAHVSAINMSFGSPDDGDPDNPMRVACRAAFEAGIGLGASAGNDGPNPGTITCPGTEECVYCVGSTTFSPWEIWSHSSRGPTKEGLIKPDLVTFGVDTITASAKSDTAFEMKSGTSFAAPIATGGCCLSQEVAVRMFNMWISPKDAWPILPLTCKKPEGAPREKDNDYGFGMPTGDLMKRLISPLGIPGIGEVANLLVPVLGIGMVGMMMSGMVKGMK